MEELFWQAGKDNAAACYPDIRRTAQPHMTGPAPSRTFLRIATDLLPNADPASSKKKPTSCERLSSPTNRSYAATRSSDKKNSTGAAKQRTSIQPAAADSTPRSYIALTAVPIFPNPGTPRGDRDRARAAARTLRPGDGRAGGGPHTAAWPRPALVVLGLPYRGKRLVARLR
jgi:hypothetical protein